MTVCAGQAGRRSKNLFGEEAPELCKRFSLQNAVREDMPPVFLWHTAEDQCVPVQNSLLFAQALAEKHVPFSLHIFPHGRHGLALATALTATAGQEDAFIRPDVAQWGAAVRRMAFRHFRLIALCFDF